VGNDWEADIREKGKEQEEIVANIPSPEKQDVAAIPVSRGDIANRRDYDVEHYLQVLVTSYAGRLRKAFAADDFEQLFRLDGQEGLFDRPVEDIEPRWIRCSS